MLVREIIWRLRLKPYSRGFYQFGITLNYIESDSLAFTNAVSGLSSTPWQIHYQVRQIKNLLQGKQVHHIYRQGNGLADSLAKAGHSSADLRVFFLPSDLPQHCYTAFLNDFQGLP